MKRINPLVLIAVIILAFAQKVYSQESADTIVNTKISEVSLPDSTMRLLAKNKAQIDSLNSANMVLKGMLKESQQEVDSKNQEITDLKRKIEDLQNITIKRLEASNDTLQRRLIGMASNFLYLPYEDYSINKIAIPAFLSTQGTPLYTQYQNRLTLLQNYKSDVAGLVDNLSNMAKDLEIGFTSMRNQRANDHLKSLQDSPLYKRYTSYDDWENTYLGGQLKNICGLLKSPSEQTSSKLKAIRTNLEALLKNN